MHPTRIRLLVAIAAASAVAGWALATLVDRIGGRYLPVPWTAPMAIWLFAALLAWWAWLVRPRLRRERGTEPLSPFVAARTAALALAASRVGAGVAGIYAGAGLMFLSALDVPAGRGGAIGSGVAALGGVALTSAGLWLEHLCRIDDDADESGGSGTGLGSVAGGTAERAHFAAPPPGGPYPGGHVTR